MNKALRSKLAMLWRECLETKPDIFDEKSRKRLQIRHWFDEIPQPGFVGYNYKRNGLLFIGINPGSAEEFDGLDYGNLILYKHLAALRMADEKDIVKEFDNLNGYLLGFTRGRFFKECIEPFLVKMNKMLSDVAYINLLKWRTENTRNLGKLYETSWYEYTRNQIKTLSPGSIILLGTTAGRWFKDWWENDRVIPKTKIYTLSRERGVPKHEREKKINRICNAIQKKSTKGIQFHGLLS